MTPAERVSANRIIISSAQVGRSHPIHPFRFLVAALLHNNCSPDPITPVYVHRVYRRDYTGRIANRSRRYWISKLLIEIPLSKGRQSIKCSFNCKKFVIQMLSYHKKIFSLTACGGGGSSDDGKSHAAAVTARHIRSAG